MPTTTPTSTYRLHLTSAFDLADARALVDHVDALGIDWLYLSPIQRVPEGATHGYHILDPDVVDPQLGGHEALRALHDALDARGRGVVLDIVPNHLAASTDNAWWADLLRHGPDSPHARTFDVDWDRGDRIVLPVLDRAPEDAVADGIVQVDADGADPASSALVIGEGLRLPLAPDTDLDAPLPAVLDAQHYQLMQWQAGEQVINWRRFFAVNALIGVRVEDPAVFDQIHTLILRLVADGTLDGLRVDHIDGLADPAAYLHRLREAVGPDCWVVVEKILEHDEALPADWPIDGTTGYEVTTLLTAWQVARDGLDELQEAFARRTGLRGPVTRRLIHAKSEVARTMFPSELATTRRLLGPVVQADGDPLDHASVIDGLVALAACMDGYRTYAPTGGDGVNPGSDGTIPAASRRRILAATVTATGVGARAATVTAVAQALLARGGRAGLLRLQQLTGAITAKAFEDRLLFQHVALSSLCEVGVDAHLLDDPPDREQIAEGLAARQRDWPLAGTTTSTHDTKRAEDVRSRISVLAEVPDEFLALLDQLAGDDRLPDIGGHARWLLAQTALGMLHLEGDDVADIGPRLAAYAQKALREAQMDTSHADPDLAFERRVDDWVAAITAPGAARDAIARLGRRIAVPGACNALGLLVLKLAGPGVADIYRGTEIWDASLVDPDNRRPLRTDLLRKVLADVREQVDRDRLQAVRDMRRGWSDGRLKLHVTREGLHLRRRQPHLFTDGGLDVPDATGPAADHVAAVRRTAGDAVVIGVTTRLPLGLAGGGWPVGDVWQGTSLIVDVPGDEGTLAPRTMTELLTGQRIEVAGGLLPMDTVLTELPVAMLVSDD